MKHLSRILSVVISAVMLLVSFPAVVSFGAESAAYSSQLTSLEQTIYDGYVNYETSINVRTYSASLETVQQAMDSLLKKRPEIFYVSKDAISFTYTSGGKISKIKPNYIISADQISSAKTEFAAAVSEITADLTDDIPIIQKLLIIHDRLILRGKYINTSDGATADGLVDADYSAYGVLVNKRGVCDSYAKAFKYFADMYGVENEILYTEKNNRMWNQVCIGGKWYNVDVARDDTASDLFANVSHTSFIFSDQTATGTLGYLEGYETKGATDISYDSAFWKSSQSAFFLAGDVCVYSLKTGQICTYNFKTSTSTTIVELTSADRWKINGLNSVYSTYFSRPIYYNGLIYYNTPKSIYTVRLDGTGKSIVYTYTVDDRQIFGLGYDNGVASFTVKTTPNGADDVIPLSAASKAIEAISITKRPDKTVYFKGEPLDLTGLVVTVEYSDGSTFDLLDSDYTVGSFDSSTVGNKELLITYANKNVTLELRVITSVDLNNDNSTDSADILALTQHMLGISIIGEERLSLADMDGNGRIDTTDLVVIQCMVLEIN